MKRLLTVLLTFIIAVGVASTLTACGDKGNDNGSNTTAPAEYTITFESMGGSAVAEIKGSAGAEIQAPAAPVKSGFEFSGWFESADGGVTLAEKAFSIGIMPARNVTLYAKWTAISEVGKKYAVKDYKTDVDFKFDDPAAATPEGLDEYKLAYSSMKISFKANNAVEIYLHAELPTDNTHFYAINSENRVEFFETEDDAKNMTNKITADYFGWDYLFDSNKKTLTVSVRFKDKFTLKMVLSVTE